MHYTKIVYFRTEKISLYMIFVQAINRIGKRNLFRRVQNGFLTPPTTFIVVFAVKQ